ncbi:MAG: hypothetical protein ACOX8H_11680 [Ruminococcus sp.]
MFCQTCGKKIPENEKFCSYCKALQENGSAQKNSYADQNNSEQQHSKQQQTDEKIFRKYITPHVLRYILIILGIAIVYLLIAPLLAISFVFILGCIIGIPWAISCRHVNKRICAAQTNGVYKKVVQEFASSMPILGGKVRYSENYLFGKGTGRFLAYKDICWIYQYAVRYMGFPFASTVMIGDCNGNVFSFCKLKLKSQAGRNEIKALAALIYSKNPEVLLGFDAEKKKEYKKRINRSDS